MEPHEVKKKSFDLSGNRIHDLWIRSTVTLPTELRGRTEKVGDTSELLILQARFQFSGMPLRENLVVNNKGNRVFMSRNYRSDSYPLEI